MERKAPPPVTRPCADGDSGRGRPNPRACPRPFDGCGLVLWSHRGRGRPARRGAFLTPIRPRTRPCGMEDCATRSADDHVFQRLAGGARSVRSPRTAMAGGQGVTALQEWVAGRGAPAMLDGPPPCNDHCRGRRIVEAAGCDNRRSRRGNAIHIAGLFARCSVPSRAEAGADMVCPMRRGKMS